MNQASRLPSETYVVEVTSDTRHCVVPDSNHTRIDITPLASCQGLESLQICHGRIRNLDLSPLASCHNLKTLRILTNPLEQIDLQPLTSCLNLETIELVCPPPKQLRLLLFSSSERLVGLGRGGNGLRSLDLEPLSSCPNLREIHVKGNRLQTIRLPRAASLRALNIGHNRLTELDMTPLEDCPNLECLILRQNELTAIDLTPLYNCPKLRALELLFNPLKHLDVTPLIISDRRPSRLFVNKGVALTSYAHPGHVLKVPYHGLVIEPPRSWAQIRPFVQEGGPYIIQQRVLSALGLDAFGLIDSDLSEQLALIPPDTALGEVKRRAEALLVHQVIRQIDTGGTTIGLRLDEVACHEQLATKASTVLDLRRAEMEAASVPVHRDTVDLRPLWFTAYGFDLLVALRARVRTDLAGLENVKTALHESGFELRTTVKRFRADSGRISANLRRCILQMAKIGSGRRRRP